MTGRAFATAERQPAPRSARAAPQPDAPPAPAACRPHVDAVRAVARRAGNRALARMLDQRRASLEPHGAARLQRHVATDVTQPQGDGTQQRVVTHAMPVSQAQFLADHGAHYLTIGHGHSFFTGPDTAHNAQLAPDQGPLWFSCEWDVDYQTPPSAPPAIQHIPPAVTRHYLHAHLDISPDGTTRCFNLHVKTTPGGGIAYALVPAVGNQLGLSYT